MTGWCTEHGRAGRPGVGWASGVESLRHAARTCRAAAAVAMVPLATRRGPRRSLPMSTLCAAPRGLSVEIGFAAILKRVSRDADKIGARLRHHSRR